MRNFILLLLFLLSTTLHAQYTNDAPWMHNLQTKNNQKQLTLSELSNAFNAYWNEHKDLKNKKGSGYKPFKRWENRWMLEIDKQGKIISNKTRWEQWKQKNALSGKSTNASNWQSLGPFTQLSKNGQRRVNVVAVDPNCFFIRSSCNK